jgi:hypothetical protein
VLRQLHQLEQQLGTAQTQQLLPFNLAYIVVTAAIGDGLASGYFTNPRLIEEFTVSFAGYYFRAINGLLAGNPALPAAWAKLAARPKPLPPSIALLMGASAHINHDLPLALQQTLHGRKSTTLLGDLVKVDRLLVKGTRQILGRYEETNRLLNFIKRRCRWLYFWPVIWLVRYWRIRAWYTYISQKTLYK